MRFQSYFLIFFLKIQGKGTTKLEVSNICRNFVAKTFFSLFIFLYQKNYDFI